MTSVNGPREKVTTLTLPASTTDFADTLASSIEQFLAASTLGHRVWWNNVLTEALDSFAPGGEPPTHGMAREAFLFFVNLASRNANPSIAIVDDPPWLQRHYPNIVDEVESCRPSATHADRPTYVKAGRAALELTYDSSFFQWAQVALNAQLSRSMKITYIFYGTEGQRCRIHLDSRTYYEYNCLIGIRTERRLQSADGSRLRVILPTGETKDIDLTDRRVALFHSSQLAHGRMPLGPGENIAVLSIGLNGK